MEENEELVDGAKTPNDYEDCEEKGAINFYRTYSRLPPIKKKVFKNDIQTNI